MANCDSKRMQKALQLTEYRRIDYLDIPVPDPAPDELLVRIKAVGICGSDVHGYDGSTGRRIPPLVMGHEASGIVEAAGGECRIFSPGDSVTFDSTIYCGECWYCRRGEINFCENRKVLGVSCDEYRRNGAFCEYVVVPERIAHGIPDGVSFHHAAMVEPMAVAFHALSITPYTLGGSALVVGAGVIGLLLIQLLRAAGIGTIVAVDISDERLETAADLGADILVNPKRGELRGTVLDATDGRGSAIAFDAVGSGASFDSGVQSVRRGGCLTLIGNVSPKIDMPLQHVVSRQIRLQGSNASAGEYPPCIDLLRRGAIDLDPLISRVASLAEGGEWIRRLYEGESGLIKVILEP